jgi:hypothetical protein
MGLATEHMWCITTILHSGGLGRESDFLLFACLEGELD